jgi:protein involved in polysaccharide export with SLBB domain
LKAINSKTVFLPLSLLALALPLAAQTPDLDDLGDNSARHILALSTIDYPATPGDVYNLSYFTGPAGTAISLPLTLDAGYLLKIQNLGTISARNKTYLQVRQEVETLVSRNYPTSGPAFTLVRMGNFTVLVTGETTAAGIRNIDGLTRLSAMMGSLTAKGSSRLATVVSEAGEAVTYDLFQARRFGDFSQNPYIRPGDTVQILPSGREVTLAGEVFRPGTYELLEGEELASLVEQYGDGFTLGADPSRIRLSRVSTDLAGETKIFAYQENAGMTLEDRDVISVPNKAATRPVVFFEGALSRATAAVEETTAAIEGTAKMEYPFYEGETLGNAARANAGRFTASSDLANAYLIRDGTHIPMDLGRFIYYNDFSKDIDLANGDTIIIPFRQYYVLVSGSVRLPGRYPYVPDRMPEYYINLAGGRDVLQNNGRGITITDMDNVEKSANEVVGPETIIWVPMNKFTANFNQIAPMITTILSIITSVISILAITLPR